MKKKIRLFVVDDDVELCKTLQEFFDMAGYETHTESDPSKALQLAKSTDYQVIVLDLILPEISGTEILREIRKHNPDIPVIILTGYPSLESAVETMEYRVFTYVKKPVKLDELKDIIEKAIRQHGIMMEPEEEVNQEIGRRLRTLRKQKQLTLKQLASKTGLSASLISQIECAYCSASISTLYKVAKALGTSLEYFFTGL